MTMPEPIRLLYPMPERSDEYVKHKLAQLSPIDRGVLARALAYLVADEQSLGHSDELILKRLKHIFGEDQR